MTYVLQDWLEGISWKKQTVLIGAIRAPDVATTLQVKKVVVWIRATVLRDADPMTGFMHAALRDLPLFEHIDRDFERLPLHSAHHLILAMQIIAREHPDGEIALEADRFYRAAVDAQHLNPEGAAQYEARMTDNAERVETGTS